MSGADAVRAAAADLALVEKAVEASRAADAHLTAIVAEVLERKPRTLTVEQVASALGISRRALHKRLSTTN